MICKHKSTKLTASKYCYVSLKIQLNISHLFANNLNVKQFYLTHICYYMLLRARVDLGAMVMNGYSAFPKAPALLRPRRHIV